MADKSVTFDIIARDRASRAFGTAEKSSGKLHGAMMKVSGVAKGALLGGVTAAAVGVAGLGAWMVQGVKDAASYQTLQNKTAAVLKSTGNAAGTSVKAIQAHAASLESLSGVDEELYINSQNVLATFTGVQNRVGRGNDIFNRATSAIADMSAALGTDLQASTIQVGKALNDPIKGITALQRVGVSFTKSQKDQIATLVKSGNVMGAQKIILRELTKEFGGAAKATGQGFEGSMARAKDAISDAGRAVGQILLPYVTRFADWVATKGVPAAIKFGQEMGPKLVAAGRGAIAFFNRMVQVGQSLWGVLQQGYQMVLPALRLIIWNVRGAFRDFGTQGNTVRGVMQALWPVLKIVGAVILGTVVAALVSMSMQIRVAGAAFRYVLMPAIRFMVQGFLDSTGRMIHAAAVAFGWIPGIGPKLRSADRAFKAFAASVNASLNGIHDRQVTVRVQAVAVNGKSVRIVSRSDGTLSIGGVGARAAGGPVAAGRPYIVGEHRPELFVPETSGRILPRVPAGSSGTVVNIAVYVQAALASKREIASAVADAVATARKGGWQPPKAAWG